MVVAFRDITDALKMREERAKASKLDSLGLLAGGIAHDFNNILMAVMGNVSMARATMPAGPAMRALDEAQQACVRARQLTWQLLTFSRGGAPVKKTMAIPAHPQGIGRPRASRIQRELYLRDRAGALVGVGRRRAARAGVHQHDDQRAAGDAPRRRDPHLRREHRRAGRAGAARTGVPTPGAPSGLPSPTRASAFRKRTSAGFSIRISARSRKAAVSVSPRRTPSSRTTAVPSPWSRSPGTAPRCG